MAGGPVVAAVTAAPSVLVTGADGYLGRLLLETFLDRGGRVVAWMRDGADGARDRKTASLAPLSERHGPRLSVAFGDLAADEPFASVDPAGVESIVHGAAVTRFNVDRETATRVNVDGARKLFAFAEKCPDLRRVAYLSTIYASGLSPGPVEEAPLNGGEFANHYERSKCEAERALLADYGRLPWQVLRIATAIADDDSGQVGRQNAVHRTLQLLYYGLISTLPGLPETPLYLVTGRFAAGAIAEVHLRGDARRFFHVSHRREQSLTLGRLVDIAFETFEQDEFFSRRKTPRPLYVDRGSFEMLRQALAGFSGGIVNEGIASVAPFAAQLFIAKDVENANLIEVLGSDAAPDPTELARLTCRHLVATRWGRETSLAS